MTSLLQSCVIFVVIAIWFRLQHQRRNLPPGPWRIPLLGNAHQLAGAIVRGLPVTGWCHQMCSALGLSVLVIPYTILPFSETEIMLLDAAGIQLVLLDTYEAAIELFVKRHKRYSTR
jgi:hypothetical protein